MASELDITPVATYRIQLTPTFGFAETIGILDHLVALGVSHVYLSPVAEAVPGSLHGYDVIDHTRVRTEFGGEDGLFALLDAARDRGLGIVIDHVPNHMSVAEAHLNDRWWEMLRDGRDSPGATWFDVDWEATEGEVVVPKLGDPLDRVLADGGLSIGEGDRGPELRYGPLRFPLAAGTEGLDVAEAIGRQHYLLQWWRDPARNVRRFFTIDDLVAVRAEDPDVAEVIDTIPSLLSAHPAFAGVRVDHVDGLAQPGAYLAGLRRRIGDHRWLLVEKILAVGETLPPSWPVDGTTGYEHIRVAEHTMLSADAEGPLTSLWTELTGDDRSFAELEDAGRREVLDGGLRPDLDRLVRLVTDRAGWPDSERVRQAVVELTIGLHRYRTYLPDDDSVAELATSRRRAISTRPDLVDDIERLVDLIAGDPEVAGRWQQLTSPVMAKGAEDRAFYRYLRLAALCEVGGAPGQWSVPVSEFHRYQLEAQVGAPLALLAGTTHDTKRSEGVRARALALAEIADDWAAVVRDWLVAHRDLLDRGGIDAATTLLALETAVTAWPIDAERLTEYLVKSAREAEEHTSWTAPDAAYEEALARLADVLEGELSDLATAGPLGDVVAVTLRSGWARSLGSLAIRLTAPGVPDLYQGTAAFTYSLVDPDNRVEPDWNERRSLVDRAAELDGPTAWTGGEVDVSKAVVITRTLGLRRRHAAAFGPDAAYAALDVTGDRADAVIAFARADSDGPAVVTIVATREVTGWADTALELPDGAWRNVLDDDADVVVGGTSVPVRRWLKRFPVAVVERM
ncbi:MAG: malto-oligosyltrehalose synthase [Ilumatobacteraceae bacterium]